MRCPTPSFAGLPFLSTNVTTARSVDTVPFTAANLTTTWNICKCKVTIVCSCDLVIVSPSAYFSPFSGSLVVSFDTVRCESFSSVSTLTSPSPVTSSFLGSLPIAVALFTIVPSRISSSVTV